MTLRIITLSENTATYGFQGEFGLSIFIEFAGRRILLDTGMTDVAVRNAARFNIDFTQLDAIVISHGHRDHTGGLPHILKKSGPRPVIAHPDIFTTRYTLKHKPEIRDITLPYSKETLESQGAQFRFVTDTLELYPGIYVSGEVPMKTTFEHIEKSLQCGSPHQLTPDPLRDDMSLAIRTAEGLFIVTGCAHRGIINIMRHFQRVTGEQRVYAILGGLHLSNATESHIATVIAALKDADVRKVVCSHCTGFHASCALSQAFGNHFTPNHSGTRLVFNLEQ